MNPPASRVLLEQLTTLRDELTELAFVLDRRGGCQGADVATPPPARLRDLQADFEARIFPVKDVRNAAVGSLNE